MTRNSDLVTAVEDSLRAPSVHNTQPWRWRFRGTGVELHADRGRQLAATDPEGRDLVLSCGAACTTCGWRSPCAASAARSPPDPDDGTTSPR